MEQCPRLLKLENYKHVHTHNHSLCIGLSAVLQYKRYLVFITSIVQLFLLVYMCMYVRGLFVWVAFTHVTAEHMYKYMCTRTMATS